VRAVGLTGRLARYILGDPGPADRAGGVSDFIGQAASSQRVAKSGSLSRNCPGEEGKENLPLRTCRQRQLW
jgi:hypothetical protein